MSCEPLRIVFFGTPPFAAQILNNLIDEGLSIVAVVTRSDKPQGRSGRPHPSAVKELTLQRLPDTPLFQPDKISSEEWIAPLQALNADLFVVVAYGEILKQHLLDMPKLACINLHASLLPKLRGAAPIQRSIIEGESVTGVSVMHMVKKMDAGNVIATAAVKIGEEMTYGELEQELFNIGAPLLVSIIHQFSSQQLPGDPQEDFLVTFAPKIELEECEIDWKKPAAVLQRLIHGVNPEPGAWCWVEVKGERKRLKVWRAKLLADVEATPGELIPNQQGLLIVGTGRGALQLQEVQLEGKRAMPAKEWLRGAGKLDFKF